MLNIIDPPYLFLLGKLEGLMIFPCDIPAGDLAVSRLEVYRVLLFFLLLKDAHPKDLRAKKAVLGRS